MTKQSREDYIADQFMSGMLIVLGSAYGGWMRSYGVKVWMGALIGQAVSICGALALRTWRLRRDRKRAVLNSAKESG